MDPTQAQIALFRKFAHLYDSGVSLAEALDLARGEQAGELHEVLGEVLDDLYRGTSLSDALAARSHCFSPEVVALMRAGELRGELSAAARSAAEGLANGVLERAAPDAAAGEALLIAAGDARFLHVSGDVARVRTADGLVALADPVQPGAVTALRERAGAGGAFLWQDRLVRVAAAAGHLAIEISSAPGPEPAEAAAWRGQGRGLLVLDGDRRADFDAAMRAVLRGFDAETMVRVSVGLPTPEAVEAEDVAAALRLDPDVVAVRHPTAGDLEALARAGVAAIVVCPERDVPAAADYVRAVIR